MKTIKIRVFGFALLALFVSAVASGCASNNGLAKRKPKSSCNCPHF